MKVIEVPETYDQKLDRMLSYFDHLPLYVSRGKYSNYNPKNNMIAVRTRPESDYYYVKQFFFGANLVTNDGDIYYSKKGAGETPATNENFLTGRFELRNSADTPAKADNYGAVAGTIAGSRKTFDSTYPKTNDTGDTDNTGDGVNVVSYRVSWTTSDFNATGIVGGIIHDNASPVAGTKLLNHFSITSFDKTASDTLKLFCNHTMLGS
jgi:hypothetical protein